MSRQILFIFFLFFWTRLESQGQTLAKYPYGGQPDTSRFDEWMTNAPLNFEQPVLLFSEVFDDTLDFSHAKFVRGILVDSSKFTKETVFDGAIIARVAYFQNSSFDSLVSFTNTIFPGHTSFSGVLFKGVASFSRAVFDSSTSFRGSTIDHRSIIDFTGAKSKDFLDFSKVTVKGKLWLGSSEPFLIDLTLANLSEGTIELWDNAQLRLQERRLNKLSLVEILSFTEKESIINYLKEKSFSGDKIAAFELDYLLARSTIFQEKSDVYEPVAWYVLWKWLPAWFYDATMGFGYRPFRILWWALGIMLWGTLFYFWRMGNRINEYIAITFYNKDDREFTPQPKKAVIFIPTKFETLLNCAYFSVMLFFTFRLKGGLLTFFNAREKKIIVTEWLLGLAVYVAFLYHTSSVLQNIRTLFIGN